jgi:hypothetical protein
MTDELDLQLRARLRGLALPAAPASLSEFLREVPQRRATSRPIAWQPKPLLLAATLAALIVLLLTIFALGSRPPVPTPRPTTDASQLLRDLPSISVVLTHAVERAPDASSAPAPELTIGTVDPDGVFMVGASCVGSDDMHIKVGADQPVMAPFPSGQPAPSTSAELRPALLDMSVVCDGTGRFELLDPVPAYPGPHPVRVTAAGDASWQVAVGEFEDVLAQRPIGQGNLPPTAGWGVVLDLDAGLLTELNPYSDTWRVPMTGSRLAVTTWCLGPATITVSAVPEGETVGADDRVSTECPSDEAGVRHEFAVTPGSRVTLTAQADGAAWLHMLVEVSADVPYVRSSPPPLPAAVADTPFATVWMGEPSLIAVGRIGEIEQQLTEAAGVFFARARGAYLLVAAQDAGIGRYDLWSVEPLERLRTLATASYPELFEQTWLDLTHEQLFYVDVTQDGASGEIRRVGLDGTGDRLIATVGLPRGGALARDDSLLVIDACDESDSCLRTPIDTETGRVDGPVLPAPGDAACYLTGVSDGVAVSSCQGDAGVHLIAKPLSGGGVEQTYVLGEIFGSAVVETDEGPQVVYSRLSDQGGGFEVINLASGEIRTLLTIAPEDIRASLTVAQGVGLPPNWVLLATDLGDFPGSQTYERPVPLLFNLATGERYELVNLPHTPNL